MGSCPILSRFIVVGLSSLLCFGADTSWYGATFPHGSVFRSVTQFGAIGDGVHDDTVAIQAAIDYERGSVNAKAAAIVYFPPGTYLITDTLVVWAYTILRGCSTEPPTLRLGQNAPGFSNVTGLKPLIATTGGYDRPTTNKKWWDNSLASNCIFYMHIHQFSIDLSAPGNEGAVAIYWCVAQQTSIRNVNITLGAAYAGIDICVSDSYPQPAGGGNGGGGTIEDVSISGGVVGVRADSSQWAFRGMTFAGQASSAIHLQDMIWNFAFVDINASSMPAFITTGQGMDTSSSMISVIDAVLYNITGPSAIDLWGSGSPVFLQNVYLAGVTLPLSVVSNGSATWLPISSFIHRWAGWTGGDASNGLFVAGSLLPSPQAFLPGAPAGSLPSIPRPYFDNLAVPPCNVKSDCGAGGTNVTDDTQALQSCIDKCTAVFLPFGVYAVSDTLMLHTDTIIVGEGLTNIYLIANASGFGDRSVPKAIIQTPDASQGSVQLTDLSVITGDGNVGAVLLSWRIGGKQSGLWDFNGNISHNVLYGVHATGSGAGIFSNVWIWGADHSWWSMDSLSEDHADIGFLGESAGPLTAYGLASEHHRLAMVALRNASNYTLVVFQSEEANPLPGANLTVHIELSGGTRDTTIHGALSCDWWGKVLDLAEASDVGTGVSIFGLRNRGSANGPIAQPSSPGINVTAVGGWFGLLADVNIPTN